MKTTNHAFTWKRGLCASVAALLMALTGCSSKAPVATGSVPGAAAGGSQVVTTEAPAKADTAEDVQVEESPVPETAEPVVTETVKPNACGENLTWTLTDYGALVIEGSGAMYDYDETNRAPWYAYRGTITSLQFSEGLSSIGDYAFCDCTYLQYGYSYSPKYGISQGITSIGRGAFQCCADMELLVCPENLTSIAESAFAKCFSLREIWILNKDCEINAKLDVPTELTICGFPGSTAEQYALEHGYSFNPIVEDREALKELIKQEPGFSWEVDGETRYYNVELHYNGLVPVGDQFVSQILRSEIYTLTEEEIQQAKQSGTVEALGQKYEFTDSADKVKEWIGEYADWDDYSDAEAWMRISDQFGVYVVNREEKGYTFHIPSLPNGEGWIRTYTPVGWLLLDADSPADQNGMPCKLTDFFCYGGYPKTGNHVQQLELNGNGEIVLLWASAGKK